MHCSLDLPKKGLAEAMHGVLKPILVTFIFIIYFIYIFLLLLTLYYVIQFYRHWGFPPPLPHPSPIVDCPILLHNHSSSSVEIPSLQAYTYHKIQHLIVNF